MHFCLAMSLLRCSKDFENNFKFILDDDDVKNEKKVDSLNF